MDLALALDFGAGCGAAEFRVAVHGVHLDARVTWGALRKRKVAVGEARCKTTIRGFAERSMGF